MVQPNGYAVSCGDPFLPVHNRPTSGRKGNAMRSHTNYGLPGIEDNLPYIEKTLDRANTAVRAAEKLFGEMGLEGMESVVLDVSPMSVEGDEESGFRATDEMLGFTICDGRLCICVETYVWTADGLGEELGEDCFLGDQVEISTHAVPWDRCSKYVRLDAISQLPNLIIHAMGCMDAVTKQAEAPIECSLQLLEAIDSEKKNVIE